ncbi:MAG: hypothetical protein Q4C18_04230 [Eubacteriales bacterium]|nr:hypothetical protein [Eubacteriales bacterium]
MSNTKKMDIRIRILTVLGAIYVFLCAFLSQQGMLSTLNPTYRIIMLLASSIILAILVHKRITAGATMTKTWKSTLFMVNALSAMWDVIIVVSLFI